MKWIIGTPTRLQNGDMWNSYCIRDVINTVTCRLLLSQMDEARPRVKRLDIRAGFWKFC